MRTKTQYVIVAAVLRSGMFIDTNMGGSGASDHVEGTDPESIGRRETQRSDDAGEAFNRYRVDPL
jgi:hypothetical protein